MGMIIGQEVVGQVRGHGHGCYLCHHFTIDSASLMLKVMMFMSQNTCPTTYPGLGDDGGDVDDGGQVIDDAGDVEDRGQVRAIPTCLGLAT